MGHARSSRRGRSLQRVGHSQQGRYRSVRDRTVHPQMPTVGLAIHAAVGTADRATRFLGQARRSVRHLPSKLRRIGLVVAQVFVRSGFTVRRPQNHLVVGPRWHRIKRRRGRAGLQNGKRSIGFRALSAGRPNRIRQTHQPAGLDHDAVDFAFESVFGSQ